MRAVILANLGYLCLVRQDIACAGQHLAEALAAADKNLSAILRVASWQDGKVQPSELAHPRDFIPVRQAASANLVTAALAEGHVDDAERLAGKMLEEAPESPWGYRMVGWVALAKGDSPGAQAMWRQGMKLTKGTEERQVLEHLLETLTP